MSDSRTKNTTRNIVYGSLNKIVTLGLPFVTRTVILYLLGTQYLGIGTLFSSILSFLSLAELGFASAVIYAMYKPIADGDLAAISALLNYYKKLYRLIGGIILLVGVLMLPAIPFFIKGDTPQNVNIYILYILYLINSVISYFFAGYKQSLLVAHQRNDIVNNIATIISVGVQGMQIVSLVVTKNFYVYAFVPICGTVATNLCNSIITKRKYGNIACSGTVSDEIRREIRSKIGGLFGTKLNSIVVHSADTVIISAFLGLTVTAQYGNYYYIMNAVSGFVMMFFSSMTASIGNKLVTESVEENYTLFKRLEFVNSWIVGWSSICLICLYEPFMTLWAGADLRLGIHFALLMTLYFYIFEIQRTILTFKDAAGLWHRDKYRPYASMMINLVSNLILVQKVGIYGIVISTIIAFLISLPWANHILFRDLFHKSSVSNIIYIVKNIAITIVIAALCLAICAFFPGGILGIALRVVFCCVVPNTVYAFLFRNTEEFEYAKNKVAGILHRFTTK